MNLISDLCMSTVVEAVGLAYKQIVSDQLCVNDSTDCQQTPNRKFRLGSKMKFCIVDLERVNDQIQADEKRALPIEDRC